MITLRPCTPEDTEFLHRVYASTRIEELARVPWTEAEKDAFTRMQYNAQAAHYARYYTTAAFDVIEVDGQPAGRLIVDRWPAQIRIVDIAVLPEFRRKGVGSQLIAAVQAEGRATGLPVSVHVERFNPALRLYERMGFQVDSEADDVYLLLRWTPPPVEQEA